MTEKYDIPINHATKACSWENNTTLSMFNIVGQGQQYLGTNRK